MLLPSEPAVKSMRPDLKWARLLTEPSVATSAVSNILLAVKNSQWRVKASE